MAFVPFNDVANVFFQFTGPDDEECGYSIDFKSRVAIGPTEMETLGSAVASWFDTEMQTLMTAGFTLQRLIIRDLSVADSWVTDWVGILPLTGSLAGNSMPSNVCWALKKKTGFAGRSFRGRIYHMGLSEDVVSGNYVDSTYAASVLDAWNELITQAAEAGDGWDMVVCSRFADGVERTTGVATLVTGIVNTDLIVDTQRRRLPRS